MDRVERTELFGRHVICATASRAPRPGFNGWEVLVSALEFGSKPDAPLLRFAPVEQAQDDPSAALDAALRKARRQLMAAEGAPRTVPRSNGAR
jgi:hypothetical protein